MNIIFPTISRAIQNIDNRGIYPDLVRKLAEEGHNVYVVFPKDRDSKVSLEVQGTIRLLGIPFYRIIKSNPIERLWAMWRISSVFEKSISEHFGDVNFDLVLYATPPITFNKLIKRLKLKHQALCYLMLKDIFPQNAVDLGMMSENSIPFLRFKKLEQQLYEISDCIGCMSNRNIEYIKQHHGQVIGQKLEFFPNTIEVKNAPMSSAEKKEFRTEFGLPTDKTLVIYGGNLGKPQGIAFLKKVFSHYKGNENTHFVICGTGTEARSLGDYIDTKKLSHVTFINGLDRKLYDKLEASADIALVFLDARFTIPNYPSRILSYMENAIPILFSVDKSTDVAHDAEANAYGINTFHGDLNQFTGALDSLISNPKRRDEMGTKGREYLLKNFSVEFSSGAITDFYRKRNKELN